MARPDHSFYLAHFTKASKSGAGTDSKKRSALENLICILEEKTIKKHSVPWVGTPVVCFTECPWSSLLKHAEAYSPYGIGFNKRFVYEKGGNPVFYINPTLYGSQESWNNPVRAFLTPFVPSYAPQSIKEQGPNHGEALDYSHEREWRVQSDFSFDYKDLCFVILERLEDLDSIPQEIVNAIGKDNFLFISAYKKIEKLWPTHIV